MPKNIINNFNENIIIFSLGLNSDNNQYSWCKNLSNAMIFNKDQVRDPVCGAEINANDSVVVIMGDQTYYFCSDACARVFMRYLEIVSRHHDDGCGCGGNCECVGH